MANVLNIHTMEYRKSVNTPDFMDGNWLINPVLPDCDKKYWQIKDSQLKEMTNSEKKAVDDKDKADKKSKREQLIQERMRKVAEDQLIAEGLIEAE